MTGPSPAIAALLRSPTAEVGGDPDVDASKSRFGGALRRAEGRRSRDDDAGDPSEGSGGWGPAPAFDVDAARPAWMLGDVPLRGDVDPLATLAAGLEALLTGSSSSKGRGSSRGENMDPRHEVTRPSLARLRGPEPALRRAFRQGRSAAARVGLQRAQEQAQDVDVELETVGEALQTPAAPASLSATQAGPDLGVDFDPSTADLLGGEGNSEGEEGGESGSESPDAGVERPSLTGERLEQRWAEAMQHMDRTVRVAEDQTLRVRLDSDLALEVALRGAGVDVVLEGSRQALESMGDLKSELSAELGDGEGHLGEFEARERDLSGWDERSDRERQSRGDEIGQTRDANGGLTSRILKRGQLVETVA